MYLSQEKYIERVLKRFHMDNAKPVATPLALQTRLSKEDCPKTKEDKEFMSLVPYSNVVGSIMYAIVCTRPDVAQAVSVVSRYMVNPQKSHWLAVKWILRYLHGTSNVCIEYGRKNEGLQVFIDADFGGDLDQRKSTLGYVFCLEGSAISWKSSLQGVVAQSTTEVEYMAVSEGFKEAQWLKGFVSELMMKECVHTVFCDSQSAIDLAMHQNCYYRKTKHIEIKFHYIRDTIEKGGVLG